MNQKKLSQSFNLLLKAQTPCEIVQYVTECSWYQDGNLDEPPIPTLEDLQNFTQNAQDNDWVVIGRHEWYEVYRPDEYQQLLDDIDKNFRSIQKQLSFIESDAGRILFSMKIFDPELPFRIAKELSKKLVSIPVSEREAWLEKQQASIKQKQAESLLHSRQKLKKRKNRSLKQAKDTP